MKKVTKFTPAYWFDLAVLFFIICYLVVRTDLQDYGKILSLWILLILIYFIGALKILLFKDFKSLSNEELNPLEITLKKRIFYGFLFLIFLFGTFISIYFTVTYYDRGIDALWFRTLNSGIISFVFSIIFGIRVYTGKRLRAFKWLKPEWGEKLRRVLGLKSD